MGRKRTLKEHKGLPERWRVRGKAYYYQVPAAQRHLWDGRVEFRLGGSLTEAYRTWAERLETIHNITTFGQLLDRYAAEVTPSKAAKSQASDIASMERVKKVFQDAPINAIKPAHVYKYRDAVGRKSKSYANQDIALISHAYTKAVEWGLIDKNPIKGEVLKFGVESRNRYVEDWELSEFLKVASDLVIAYLQIKMLTGLRKGDILGLGLADLKEDGIHVTPSKTVKASGKRLVIAWTDELQAAVATARQIRGTVTGPWLFCTRRGQPYRKEDGTTSGFDSIWQRQMKKALDETKLTQRFGEHDLRAKVASDTDLEHASKLLGHTSEEITRKVYRRKGEVVKPAKWGKESAE